MTWRRPAKASSFEPNSDQPTLESVLEHYGVHFRPGRHEQMVKCPLHEDNTPSCSVNTSKQLWNCKSCGNAGSSLTLIMRMEDIDLDAARAFAAAQSLSAGDAGRSSGDVRSGRWGGNRSVPPRSRDQRGDGRYIPSWRSK